MWRVVLAALLVGLLGAAPVAAQEPPAARQPVGGEVFAPWAPGPVAPPGGDAPGAPAGPPWQPVWGLAGLRVMPEGVHIAPNGQEFHPSFTLDLNFNMWIWPAQGLYLFAEGRFWGERPEYGVTNGRDGGLGFSKREFDLAGGAAWNYSGPWEARVSGYSYNNLNRGNNAITPYGIVDGALLENRYYLSPEYARLGQPGFDVARATFLSVGGYPTKNMVGNNGVTFKPAAMLRAYLIYDILDWPVYAYGDATLISNRQFLPRLLLFDVGLAARPFQSWRQWEFRAGVENTADFHTRSVFNIWYVALRYIF